MITFFHARCLYVGLTFKKISQKETNFKWKWWSLLAVGLAEGSIDDIVCPELCIFVKITTYQSNSNCLNEPTMPKTSECVLCMPTLFASSVLNFSCAISHSRFSTRILIVRSKKLITLFRITYKLVRSIANTKCFTVLLVRTSGNEHYSPSVWSTRPTHSHGR